MLDGNFLSYLSLGLGSGLMATAALAGMALPFSKTLQDKVFPKPQESLLSDLLPFHHLAPDGETIVCKDETWSKVIALDGFVEGTQTEEERIAQGMMRRQWLDAFAKEEIAFSLMTHRFVVQRSSYAQGFDDLILRQIDEQWRKGFERTYRTFHFVLLSKKPGKKVDTELTHWNEMTQTLLDYLKPYQPKVLKETEEETGLLSFWSHLVNGFDDHAVWGQGHDFSILSRRLVSSTVHFYPAEGIIELCSGGYEESIKEVNFIV